MFSFCFLDLQCTIPYPKDMHLTVWLLNLGWTPYAESTNVHNWIRLSALIIVLSYMVFLKYYNTRLNVALSSLVLLDTLVHRNNMAGSMLGLTLFTTHINFVTMEWKMSAFFFYSILELSSMFCRLFFSGDDTLVLSSSTN